MKYFSMFSGIGGFEYGIQSVFQSKKCKHETEDSTSLGQRGVVPKQTTGLGCVGFSEVDKYAIQIYKKQFPNHKEYGDATRIIPEEIKDFDLICGGFPCQAFSIAGKRGGFKDTRGTLFHEIARIVSVKRPKLLFLENVAGLLSHDNGKTFGTILSTFSELGYICEWQILNSKDFGVPQNRERVFIIGHLRGSSSGQVFPLEGTAGKDIEILGSKSQCNTIFSSEGSSPTISSGTHGYSNGSVCIPEATKKGYAIAEEGDSINLSVPSSKTRRGRVGKGVAQTLDTGMQQHTLQNCRIRRLTPTECERLQGFPDGWTEGISDTQRYKCLGNAVTTNVISAIFSKILDGEKII